MCFNYPNYCLNTFIIAWEQRGLDNWEYIVLIFSARSIIKLTIGHLPTKFQTFATLVQYVHVELIW